MKITVIGGGGFIGSHVCERLMQQSNQVTIFDQPSSPYLSLLEEKGASVYYGSFLDKDALLDCLKSTEMVIHLAATTVPKSSNDDPLFDVNTNLVGAINIFDAAKKRDVKKMVIASSGGTVYGIPQKTPISEDHPTNPISSYGIIKLAIEKYAHMFNQIYDLNYSILRISNAYGERQQPGGSQGLIATVVSKAVKGEELDIWGDGSVIRDYIHVKDVASAVAMVATSNQKIPLLNIGSGRGYSVNEVLNLLSTKIQGPLHIRYSDAKKHDVPVNILDCTKAHQLLGWFPKIEFSEGLDQLINYYTPN